MADNPDPVLETEATSGATASSKAADASAKEKAAPTVMVTYEGPSEVMVINGVEVGREEPVAVDSQAVEDFNSNEALTSQGHILNVHS